MNIAVVTEVSTKDKNVHVVKALESTGHRILNLGMTGDEGQEELSYMHTGFITALLLNAGSADLVVGGCGTGHGYNLSAMQYPGVFCGLVLSPLDAWLFRQINNGNCISLALNKGFGWAGDVNIEFIFEKFFSVEAGRGYPAHRQIPQQIYRDKLFALSSKIHLGMPEIIAIMPEETFLPSVKRPGVMEAIKNGKSSQPIIEAIDTRLNQYSGCECSVLYK